jgi:hypothetical protein
VEQDLHMEKKIKLFFTLCMVIIISGVTTTFLILNLDSIRPYSWDTDPKRLEFPETVSNLTLIIYYGSSNGTTEEFQNITLTDHYTTVFDLINEYSIVEFRIYWQNDNAVFYVSSINYLKETATEGWRYTINDQYALGANTISPANNSVVRWFFTG